MNKIKKGGIVNILKKQNIDQYPEHIKKTFLNY